jgi:hypothetical protein
LPNACFVCVQLRSIFATHKMRQFLRDAAAV